MFCSPSLQFGEIQARREQHNLFLSMVTRAKAWTALLEKNFLSNRNIHSHGLTSLFKILLLLVSQAGQHGGPPSWLVYPGEGQGLEKHISARGG